MSEHHPIQDLMNGTMEKIKSMIDANTVWVRPSPRRTAQLSSRFHV